MGQQWGIFGNERKLDRAYFVGEEGEAVNPFLIRINKDILLE